MSEIERIVREVDSSMAMEGLPLTAEDKDRIRRCLSGHPLWSKPLAACCASIRCRHRGMAMHKDYSYS